MTDNFDNVVKLAFRYAKLIQAAKDAILFLETDEYADRGFILALLKQAVEDER